MKNNILILGASSDIGIEITKHFLFKGKKIFAHYSNNKSKLNILKKKYKNNLELIKYSVDLDDSSINDNEIKKIFNLDVCSVINLIGFTDNKSFINTSSFETLKNLYVNMIFPQIVIKSVINQMIKKKFGRILNVTSIGSKFGGGNNNYNYSLSKHSLEFIPQYFKTLSKNNIFINNLRLGVVDTKIHKKILKKNLKNRINMIPVKRMCKPKELVDIIDYLSTDKNSFITLDTITVAGGE